MKRIRKYLLAGCFAAAILVAVVVALILASRWLTGSNVVRDKITTEAARLTGGQLHYEKLALHLLPLPHLTVLQADFQIPEKIALTTALLAIYPDMLALASGNFELEDIVIVRPTIRIEQDRAPVQTDSSPPTVPEKQLHKIGAAVFGALSKLGPDLTIRIKDGAVTVIRPEKPPIKVEQIDLRLNSRGQEVSLDLDCRSVIGGQMTLKGTVNLKGRTSSGRLKVVGLNARPLLAELLPLPGVTLSDTRLGLEVVFTAQATEKIQARITLRVPEIQVRRQQGYLSLQNVLLKGDVAADPKQLSWDIKSLKVDSPDLDLGSSGTFTFGSRTKPATLGLAAVGRRIDVAGAAQSFTAFAGDQAWVQTAFKVAREGTLTKATCRLVVRNTENGWTVSRIRATGHLDNGLISIPGAEMNLESVRGDVVLVNQEVEFKQMQGRLPYGTFNKLDARIDWHQTATLGISTPRATVYLERFYPWLTAFEGLQDLRKFITTADGELVLTQLEIGGPLASPADWEMEIAAGVKDVMITSPELSGPLHLLQGRGALNSNTLDLKSVQMKYLDADIVTACRILGKLAQPEEIRLSLDGTLGKETLAWLRRFMDMPAYLRVQPPLEIAGMDLQWHTSGNVSLKGEIIGGAGTRAFADATFAPGRWQINRFELNDGISDVSLAIIKTGRHVELDYAGKLDKTTLDRILKDNTILKGWVDGKLKAFLDMDNLGSSLATGALRGEGLFVKFLPVGPIEFERFALDCRGKQARLQSADLIFDGIPMHLEGTAGISAQGYTFDLDLVADSFDAAVFSRDEKAAPARAAESAVPPEEKIPIAGIIRFKTPRFTFKDYSWEPLVATIAIDPDSVEVAVTRADLCGISTPGTVIVTPEGWYLGFKPAAAKQNFQTSWECLQTKPMQADGVFNLNGSLESSGLSADLLKNLQGELSFSINDGMIHRANILTKIFALLNITEMFAGKTSGLGDKGFGYAAIRAHAAIKGGDLNFDEILVDGHAMKISGAGTVSLVDEKVDVNLLVAPLKTFDRLVKKIPVVGYITGGSVLSVPVKVQGGIADPQVLLVPPGAVGRGLIGILERTLEAPLKVVESLPGINAREVLPTDQEAGKSGPVPD